MLSCCAIPCCYYMPDHRSYVSSSNSYAHVKRLSNEDERNPFRIVPGMQVFRIAAKKGTPVQVSEDSKFVQINEDDPCFGPPVMLLVGFKRHELPKVQEFLSEMDGGFMEILICTRKMVEGSLWNAVNSSQSDLTAVEDVDGLPRICFLSGLTGEEIIMMTDAFPKIGLEETVFAALVPNNADKTIAELIGEIMDDHRLMAGAS